MCNIEDISEKYKLTELKYIDSNLFYLHLLNVTFSFTCIKGFNISALVIQWTSFIPQYLCNTFDTCPLSLPPSYLGNKN